ncbi:MAG: hypothetical protein BRC35_14360 [Cyanobacteria bacterium QH_10_48_56]|nr:MAG: hypothetical protein BRC35_14360 [Cyanobacteria bacterium QH_10_48_56]
MNRKLKLALISYTSEKGFALPVVIGMGLIMTLIGMTMIMRSQGDQVTAVAQKGTAQSVATAEAGIAQVLSFINSVRIVADKDLKNWQNAYDKSYVDDCSDVPDAKAKKYAKKDWIKINGKKDNNGKKDRFKIEGYDYSSGEGTLKVKAESNFKKTPSITVLEVTIPVKNQSSSVPGLFVKQADLSNNEIDGNVLISGCDLSGSNIDNSNVNGQVTHSPFADFPALPEPPGGVTPEDLGDITNDLTLPDTNDTAAKDSDGRYHYIVDSINMNGGDKTVTITAGEKVTLYLKGDIDLKGNAKIEHEYPANPTNFQIFGSDGDSGVGDDNNDTYGTGTTEVICLSGKSTIDAFILAPKAKVAVNGGGNGNGITGTVWSDRWNKGTPNSCGSNAGKVLVTQSASWAGLPVQAPKKIAPVQSWQRGEVSP